MFILIRPKKGKPPQKRFLTEVANSPIFDRLRNIHVSLATIQLAYILTYIQLAAAGFTSFSRWSGISSRYYPVHVVAKPYSIPSAFYS